MSFFTLSTGQKAQATTSFAMMENLPPIPANTELKAAIDEAENKSNAKTGEQYIELRWNILAGEHKGRKVFQKLRHSDADPKKADKAKMMLLAIDANCGGKLVRLNRAPTDQDLMVCLSGKPMAIKVGVWAIKNEETGETSQGNWVSAVSGGSAAPKPAAATAKTVQQDVEETEAALGAETPVDDDDLGFG
jgi:hypothetical protein